MDKIRLDLAVCDDDSWMLSQLSDICLKTLGRDYDLHIHSALAPSLLQKTGAVYQIAVLDVELVEANGIEFARQLLEKNSDCRIIFVSGFLHVVSQVYQVPHLGFVLKNQLDQYLPRFLLDAAQIASDDMGRVLNIHCRRQWVRLPLEAICFLERRGHWTLLVLKDGTTLESREKLGDILDRIGTPYFVRCHVSYAVNLRHVISLNQRLLTMDSGQTVPVSRPNVQRVRRDFYGMIVPV